MSPKDLQAFQSLLRQHQADDVFIRRLQQGNLSRDENLIDHFCVYFAAYDPKRQEVFLGHHKKSNLWLFNGGHLDQGELPETALWREIGEEWGIILPPSQVTGPHLFTLTHIPSTQPIPCRLHYDIWYFVSVDKSTFHPDPATLATEFYENRWLTPVAAKELVTDANTLQAINLMCYS